MTTLSAIVENSRRAFLGAFELRYLHPTLVAFASLDDEERRKLFAERTGLPPNTAALPGFASTLSIILATPDERKHDYDFLDVEHPGQHWLPLLDPEALATLKPSSTINFRAIHFYGYKGGQARSTVLAMLARQLADDGYHVLVVDADVEAPSLNILLNVLANNLGQSLLGLLDPDQPIEPVSAYTSAPEGGRIDLLACRPESHEYDMDFAAFALRTTFDVAALENGLERLGEFVQNRVNNNYDIVLFDHRSGMATSVLPIVTACPGPVVIWVMAS